MYSYMVQKNNYGTSEEECDAQQNRFSIKQDSRLYKMPFIFMSNRFLKIVNISLLSHENAIVGFGKRHAFSFKLAIFL